MSLPSHVQGQLEDMFYDIRLELEEYIIKKYGHNVADTVELHLTELAEAILKARLE